MTPTMRRILGFVIVAMALLVRGPAMGDRSWALDDVITWNVARLPIWTSEQPPPGVSPKGIIGFCMQDRGPGPLTYLVDGFCARWAAPLGREWVLRIPGFTAAVLTVLLCLWKGRLLTGSDYGAIAMAAAAGIPLWIEFSVSPRGYSWVVLIGFAQLASVFEARLFSGARARNARLGFVVLSILAFFFHAFSVAWSGALAIALLWEIAMKRARKPALWEWIVCVASALLVAAWLTLWLRSSDAGAGIQMTGVIEKLATTMRELIVDINAETCIGMLGLLLFLGRGWDRRWSFAARLAIIAIFFHAALAAVIAMKFKSADRYLFGLSILAVWAAGVGSTRIVALEVLGLFYHGDFERSVRSLSLRKSWKETKAVFESWRTTPRELLRQSFIVFARRHRLAFFSLLLVVAAPFGPASWRTAGAPWHDWSSAIKDFSTIYKPGDVVLFGPNSEREIYYVYAQAAGLPSDSAPGALLLPDGATLNPAKAPDLARIAELGSGRVYFFTSFYRDPSRSEEYWRTLDERFVELPSTPGRAPIRLWRAK
ncbi:hypothetical protein BH09SUM1_BH09SUM1_16610 [soil metagenome]